MFEDFCAVQVTCNNIRENIDFLSYSCDSNMPEIRNGVPDQSDVQTSMMTRIDLP